MLRARHKDPDHVHRHETIESMDRSPVQLSHPIDKGVACGKQLLGERALEFQRGLEKQSGHEGNREHDKQRNYHQSAGRIVAEVAPRASPQHVAEVVQALFRCKGESRKASMRRPDYAPGKTRSHQDKQIDAERHMDFLHSKVGGQNQE